MRATITCDIPESGAPLWRRELRAVSAASSTGDQAWLLRSTEGLRVARVLTFM
ncbi:hypothetical protein LEMLEM_LOCUS4960 [Lemmus lemmus]